MYMDLTTIFHAFFSFILGVFFGYDNPRLWNLVLFIGIFVGYFVDALLNLYYIAFEIGTLIGTVICALTEPSET